MMHKLRGYARDVTMVRRSSLPVPPVENRTFGGAAEWEYGPSPPTNVTQPTFFAPSILTYVYLPVAVVSAKKKTYFELFCVPVFPLSSKHVWACGICQWRVPLQQGYVFVFPLCPTIAFSDTASYRWEPQFPGQGYHHPPPVQWQQGPSPGQYQQGGTPGYFPPPPPQGYPTANK